MRVFVTGATGFIGSAVVPELLAAGHQVIGLARSEESAATLAALGAGAHRGSLDDPDSLRAGAAASNGVIHLAFIHDFSRYIAAAEADRRAIAALGDALAGSDRPLVVTSATALVGGEGEHPATEDDVPEAGTAAHPRAASEETALAYARRGVRVSILRLPPSVHGDGDQAFVPALIRIAREKGVSGHVGDGANRWPAVHRLDAARLFRMALENAPAGSRLHGVSDEGIPLRDIAAVIGRRLGVPVSSVPAEAAAEHFGWLARFLAVDNPTSSALTRARLGWQPERPGLLADLEHGSYFAG
jgi:nucleoside-diphosphate-sugar epimerase